jgi:lipid-binding SYLF domain-containing protein
MKYLRLMIIWSVVMCLMGAFVMANCAQAATASEINRDALKALGKLYDQNTTASSLGKTAKGVLVFPGIIKGGFMVGGNYGEGALYKSGKPTSYYNTVQVSYGLQAGLQKYGYVLFFMTDAAMEWLNKTDGWEVGVGPTITVIDAGASTSFTTTTGKSDIYAFFFDQKGLMAGLGLQGTKITKINK